MVSMRPSSPIGPPPFYREGLAYWGCRSIIPLVAHHWRHEIEQKTHFHDREIWLKKTKKRNLFDFTKKTNSRENKRLLPLFPISLPQSISWKNQIKSLDKKKKKKPAAATVARSRDCWPGYRRREGSSRKRRRTSQNNNNNHRNTTCLAFITIKKPQPKGKNWPSEKYFVVESKWLFPARGWERVFNMPSS